jgi:hypothetical protein
VKTYTTEHIIVHIHEIQPPRWIWTREAKLAWLTCRPWRLKAQDATIGSYNYVEYRAYLLKQAYEMYNSNISNMPTEKMPVVKRPITMPTRPGGQGLLSTIYNTVEMEVVR